MLSLCYKSKKMTRAPKKGEFWRESKLLSEQLIGDTHSNIGLLPRSTKPIYKSAVELLGNAFAQINADQEH